MGHICSKSSVRKIVESASRNDAKEKNEIHFLPLVK